MNSVEAYSEARERALGIAAQVAQIWCQRQRDELTGLGMCDADATRAINLKLSTPQFIGWLNEVADQLTRTLLDPTAPSSLQ